MKTNWLSILLVVATLCCSCKSVVRPKPDRPKVSESELKEFQEYLKTQKQIESLLRKSGLSPQGTFVRSENNTNTCYYYINSLYQMKDPKYIKNSTGLWRSKDGGLTWEKLAHFRDFDLLHVQRGTEVLFAVLGESRLTTGVNGFFEEMRGKKIAMSADGRDWTWKDITRGIDFGYISGIFSDPDNPQRVCIYQHAPDVVMYQSTDAEYSNWKKFTKEEWEQGHKNWSWDKYWEWAKPCQPTNPPYSSPRETQGSKR